METREGAGVHAIGVDIGGTFTDATLLLQDGSTVIGKAFTTRDAPTIGALAAIEVAGAAIKRSLEAVLEGANGCRTAPPSA